ncbi:MAG: hypothetical protein WD851_05700 [Pirellulales bacterium]
MSEDPDDPTEVNDGLQIALEEQQALAESSLPLLFEAYDDAADSQVERPVVILLDCEDEIGGEIARAWLGAEEVDEAIRDREASSDSEDSTTVYARAFAWDDCRAEIPEVFPYLAEVFDDDSPENTFLTISVTAGGASALHVPLELRDVLDEEFGEETLNGEDDAEEAE